MILNKSYTLNDLHQVSGILRILDQFIELVIDLFIIHLLLLLIVQVIINFHSARWMYLTIYVEHQFIMHDVYEFHFLLMEIIFKVKLIPTILISYVMLLIIVSKMTFQDQLLFNEELLIHILQTYLPQIQTLQFLISILSLKILLILKNMVE